MPYLANAVDALEIATYDGSGQAVHPCVLDFGRGFLRPGHTTWNGYRYWMTLTPFPASNDAYENPCLYCSHDGLTWIEPPGLIGLRGTIDTPSTGAGNPLIAVDFFGEPIPFDRFLNDPHMLYIPEEDSIVVYFNHIHRDRTPDPDYYYPDNGGYRIWVDNTLTTSTPEKQSITGFMFEHHDGTWYRWAASNHDYDGTTYPVLIRYDATDGLVWHNPVAPAEPHPWLVAEPTRPTGHWHCYKREDGNTVDVIVATMNNEATDLADNAYYFARTYLNDPTRWEYPLGLKPILVPATPDTKWDGHLIYKPSFVIDDATRLLHFWYSCLSKADVWAIGYTEGVVSRIPRLLPIPIFKTGA